MAEISDTVDPARFSDNYEGSHISFGGYNTYDGEFTLPN